MVRTTPPCEQFVKHIILEADPRDRNQIKIALKWGEKSVSIMFSH